MRSHLVAGIFGLLVGVGGLVVLSLFVWARGWSDWRQPVAIPIPDVGRDPYPDQLLEGNHA